MNERQKRLIEVYEHLRKYFGIHTKTEFAEALHYGRTSMSAAMNGDEKYLTDSLFKNICEAFQGVFDLQYLLTGEGSLLTIEEEVHIKDYERLYNPQPIDNSSLVNAIIAAKDETIASLKRELDAKNETIALQRSRIAELERQTAASTLSDLSRYPFAIGAAEDGKRMKIK
jgi:transcriptional regulator with XRE-family HTH domain